MIWIHIPQELVFHADDFMGPLRGEYLVPTRPSKQEWAKLAACIDEPDDDKRAVLEAAFAKEMRENPIRYNE